MSPVKEEESLTENGSSIKEGDEKSVNKKSKNYYFPTWFDITYLFDAAMIMAHQKVYAQQRESGNYNSASATNAFNSLDSRTRELKLLPFTMMGKPYVPQSGFACLEHFAESLKEMKVEFDFEKRQEKAEKAKKRYKFIQEDDYMIKNETMQSKEMGDFNEAIAIHD